VLNSFEFGRVSFELEILKIIIKLIKSPLASWAQSRARSGQSLLFPSPFLHSRAAHEAAEPALHVACSGPPDASVFLATSRQSPSSRRRLEGVIPGFYAKTKYSSYA
jgi:hypothetical protein